MILYHIFCINGVCKVILSTHSISWFRLSLRTATRSSLLANPTADLVWRKALAPDKLASAADLSCRFSLGTRFFNWNEIVKPLKICEIPKLGLSIRLVIVSA